MQLRLCDRSVRAEILSCLNYILTTYAYKLQSGVARDHLKPSDTPESGYGISKHALWSPGPCSHQQNDFQLIDLI